MCQLSEVSCHGCAAMWTCAYLEALAGSSPVVLTGGALQNCMPSTLCTAWALPGPIPPNTPACLTSRPFLALGEVGSPVSPWVSCSICCTAEHPEMVPWNLLASKSQQAFADWPGPTILCLSNLCLSITAGLLPASLPSLPSRVLVIQKVRQACRC